jgi:hypothetical protein
MPPIQKITPCLWFDDQAEEAVEFYTTVFRNSKIVKVARYGQAGYEIHGKPAGTVMTVAFELDGQAFTALNGGPIFNSTRPSRFKSFARHRKKRTTTGTNSPKAVIKRRSSAAGSRISTVYHGKLFPEFCPRCSLTPIPKNPQES